MHLTRTADAGGAGPAIGRGTLFLVVGPSGSGKDTLIDYVRDRFRNEDRLRVMQRVVTRAVSPALEAHDTLGKAAFDDARLAGAFALSWEAHGVLYAIPSDLEATLAAGVHAIANVSRRIVDFARGRYQPLRIILITAPRDVLRARLEARGRETQSQIDVRLDRALRAMPTGADVTVIHNTGTVADAGERFAQEVLAVLAAPHQAPDQRIDRSRNP
ncbi:MAG: phosphonate metabolism protein/1,5-bisphosphokinase (PRPP-forming) PhnN [Pseudomonadota bacterium]